MELERIAKELGLEVSNVKGKKGGNWWFTIGPVDKIQCKDSSPMHLVAKTKEEAKIKMTACAECYFEN
jgi:hypothetical protein